MSFRQLNLLAKVQTHERGISKRQDRYCSTENVSFLSSFARKLDPGLESFYRHAEGHPHTELPNFVVNCRYVDCGCFDFFEIE